MEEEVMERPVEVNGTLQTKEEAPVVAPEQTEQADKPVAMEQ
jgi:hypothetical protein